MKRQIQLSIGLTPIVTRDYKTNSYVVYYEQFPQAIASGKTEDEAEINLIHIVELMFKERKEELKEYLLTRLNDSQKKELGIEMVNA